jgi:predicted LPLAT superfamily acyltransferase
VRKEKQRNYEPQAQKFASALEAQVRKAPLQWFNFYDFWSSQTLSQSETEELNKYD